MVQPGKLPRPRGPAYPPAMLSSSHHARQDQRPSAGRSPRNLGLGAADVISSLSETVKRAILAAVQGDAEEVGQDLARVVHLEQGRSSSRRRGAGRAEKSSGMSPSRGVGGPWQGSRMRVSTLRPQRWVPTEMS